MIPMPTPTTFSTDKTTTQTYYDRLSRWYDLLAGSAEQKYKQKGLELLAVQPGEIVLEVGFGTGQCLPALAQSVGSRGKVYGIDLSAGMLQVAQARLRKAGCLDRVTLMQASALQLPFPDDLFDASFMSFTLELFPAPEILFVLAESIRVLHPGGRISVVCMAQKDTAGWMVRLYELAHRQWPVYIDCRPIAASAEMKRAGFRVEQCLTVSLFGLPVDILLGKIAS